MEDKKQRNGAMSEEKRILLGTELYFYNGAAGHVSEHSLRPFLYISSTHVFFVERSQVVVLLETPVLQ